MFLRFFQLYNHLFHFHFDAKFVLSNCLLFALLSVFFFTYLSCICRFFAFFYLVLFVFVLFFPSIFSFPFFLRFGDVPASLFLFSVFFCCVYSFTSFTSLLFSSSFSLSISFFHFSISSSISLSSFHISTVLLFFFSQFFCR